MISSVSTRTNNAVSGQILRGIDPADGLNALNPHMGLYDPAPAEHKTEKHGRSSKNSEKDTPNRHNRWTKRHQPYDGKGNDIDDQQGEKLIFFFIFCYKSRFRSIQRATPSF